MVERCVRDAEAAGSSPVTSTIEESRRNAAFSLFINSNRIIAIAFYGVKLLLKT